MLFVAAVAALLVPAAALFASGGGETTAAASGTQSRPVVFMHYGGATATDAMKQRVQAYIEQQTGVKYVNRDVVNSDDYGVQLTAAIAAQEQIDVFYSDKAGMLLNKEKGVIQDITDAVNAYGPDILKLFTNPPGWSEVAAGEMWKPVTISGRIWAIPSATGKDTGVILSIRKDWADKLGMWPIDTIDQFEAYLRKVKATDLNGNGKADEIPFNPMYGDYGLEGIATSMTYPFTGSVGWHHSGYNATYIQNGQVLPSVYHPEFKTFLTRMAQWYKDGLLNPDIATSTWDNDVDLIAANRVGATSSWYSDFYGGWQTLLEKEPKAEYVHRALKGPGGSVAKFGLNEPSSPGWTYTSWAPKDIVNAGIKLQNWFAMNKDNYLVETHGVQGVDWKYIEKDPTTGRPTIEHIIGTEPGRGQKESEFYFAQGFIVFYNWNGAVISKDWRPAQYRKANLQLAGLQVWFRPDWWVSYDFTGTKVATGYEDAATFINEAIANIILNRAPVDGWEGKLAQYKTMWGNEFVATASAQYKAQGGK